jgi:hypothetical protein
VLSRKGSLKGLIGLESHEGGSHGKLEKNILRKGSRKYKHLKTKMIWVYLRILVGI